jgi:carbonic anhydrase
MRLPWFVALLSAMFAAAFGYAAIMPLLPELLAANERYAAGYAKGDLAMPPSRHVSVLVCMDARLHPEKFLGLDEGDAHVIRTLAAAPARRLRSLISYKLLGTREFRFTTRLGMLTLTNDQLRDILRNDLNADAGVDFLPFSDLDESVRQDVQTIRSSPLIPDDISISGFVFDVKTGRLREVH